MRTIEGILDQMRQALEEVNSDLASFPQYGNLYSIFRAVAASVLEQDVKLDSINSSLFLNTATGEDLDSKAREFNLTRRQGSYAVGNITILGTASILPSKLVLTEASTGLQFTLDNQISIISNKAIGSITSTQYTDLANLPAGTELFSSIFANTRFIVGNYFDPITSTYKGSLIGGSDKESDTSLKQRISNTIQSLALSNTQTLTLAAQNIPGIAKISIVENEPSLGYITVYISNNETKFLKLVKNELDLIKPIGTALQVKSFINVDLDININIETFNNLNTLELQNTIKLNVQSYINSLNPGSTLTREAIAASVLKSKDVFNVTVATPTSNITFKNNELINLKNFSIGYLNS